MPSAPIAAAEADAVWDLLARLVRPGPVVDADPQAVLGRVLAADVRAAFDFPPFDRAVMDGFAVRCADFTAPAPTLVLRGLARAGFDSAPAVDAGTCLQINTGAPLPRGADAVVLVENSQPAPDGRVRLADAPRPGQHVEPRGAILRRGDLLLRAGTRIGPAAAAALTAGAADRLRVFAPPRVALLTTGDEVLPPRAADPSSAPADPASAPPVGPRVYNSNRTMLAALIASAHARFVDLGHSPDAAAALRAALEPGLDCDLLCVTGGMSRGSHDLVPDALESLGVEWLVTSLNLKPGKPTRIGRSPRGAWVLGLPGNPVSCAVCFLLFARPILDGLEGLPVRPPPLFRASLESSMPANGARPLFQPATWYAAPDGAPLVSPLPWRGSGDPFGMSVADALIHRPARAPAASAGDSVRFIPLDVPR